MCAGHDDGGAARGRIAALIETCKINGIEPFAYLKPTLEAIAARHPKSRIEDLLPLDLPAVNLKVHCPPPAAYDDMEPCAKLGLARSSNAAIKTCVAICCKVRGRS